MRCLREDKKARIPESISCGKGVEQGARRSCLKSDVQTRTWPTSCSWVMVFRQMTVTTKDNVMPSVVKEEDGLKGG